MSDLKPCPFCGGTVIGRSIAGAKRECESCGASGPWKPSEPAERDAAWNERPGEEALRSEVERLRDELGRWECL